MVPAVKKTEARKGERAVIGEYATYEEARRAIEALKVETPRKWVNPRIRMRTGKWVVTAMRI